MMEVLFQFRAKTPFVMLFLLCRRCEIKTITGAAALFKSYTITFQKFGHNNFLKLQILCSKLNSKINMILFFTSIAATYFMKKIFYQMVFFMLASDH